MSEVAVESRLQQFEESQMVCKSLQAWSLPIEGHRIA